jgi:hypothetical protein
VTELIVTGPAFDPPGALAAAIEAALPGWVVHQVRRFAPAFDSTTEAAAHVAGVAAAAEVSVRLRALLAQDVDEQRTNPLSVLRAAARYPTEVLVAAGARPPRRDEFDQRAFPDDVFCLGPVTWRDLGDAVHEAGIVWGAWKAKTVLDRRRAEGKR